MKIKKLLITFLLVVVAVFAFTGCSQATTVRDNIKKSADRFDVYRKMTFVNLNSDKVLYSIEGYFSLQTTYDNAYQGQQEIGIVVMIGKDKYQMHYFSIDNNVTYVIEQIENTHTDPYFWDLVWYVPFPNGVRG